MSILRALSTALVLPVLLLACPGSKDDGDNEPKDGSLIVGLQTDDFGPLVGSIHFVAKVNGAVVKDETFLTTPQPINPSLPPSPPPLPKEFPITGAPGAKVEITAEALPPNGGAPIVLRDASALLVGGGKKKLLRVYLEGRCMVLPPVNGSGPAGLTCNAPLTCLGGLCQPREVAETSLEEYEPGWAAAPPDICRPANHGPPTVTIGTGQTAYGTLNDQQTLQLEKGPQGGHHIWVAARMKNLRQSGSTTSITGKIVGDPEPVPPMSFVFTFERDEGSYCAIWGLRYQVDAGATDLRQAYRRFLGKKLEVTVEIKDSTGASAKDTRTVQIADKLLCPDGTDACNNL
jgi:hypothetical protein